MVKKLGYFLTTFLAVSMLLCSNTFASFVELNVPKYTQEKSNWCWVTAAKMAGNYLSPTVTVSQSQLVFNIKGSYDNKTGTVWEAARAMEMSTFPTQSATVKITGYFPWSDTKKSINNGYPLVALVADSMTSQNGHYYVIKGYDPDINSIKVIDPSNGKEATCTWNSFVNGTWDEKRPYQYSVYFKSWNS